MIGYMVFKVHPFPLENRKTSRKKVYLLVDALRMAFYAKKARFSEVLFEKACFFRMFDVQFERNEHSPKKYTFWRMLIFFA